MAIYQYGVLCARKEVSVNWIYDNYVFMLTGVIMIVDGILIIFFRMSNVRRIIRYPVIAALIITSAYLLIGRYANIPEMIFYVIIMIASAVLESAIAIFSLIVENRVQATHT